MSGKRDIKLSAIGIGLAIEECPGRESEVLDIAS
jgi:hypothetical protein|tara:strand:+ start:23 stop:124 length:102 start_codon:yes stop_codon:yes gene_type:complete